jgi:hypothetical protein
VWGSAETADAERRDNEKRAFGKVVDNLAPNWPKLVQRYDGRS